MSVLTMPTMLSRLLPAPRSVTKLIEQDIDAAEARAALQTLRLRLETAKARAAAAEAETEEWRLRAARARAVAEVNWDTGAFRAIHAELSEPLLEPVPVVPEQRRPSPVKRTA